MTGKVFPVTSAAGRASPSPCVLGVGARIDASIVHPVDGGLNFTRRSQHRVSRYATADCLRCNKYRMAGPLIVRYDIILHNTVRCCHPDAVQRIPDRTPQHGDLAYVCPAYIYAKNPTAAVAIDSAIYNSSPIRAEIDSDGADLLYYRTIRPAEDCDVVE